MTQAAVGWADLLHVLAALPEERREEAANALGFERRTVPRPPAPAPAVEVERPPALAATTTPDPIPLQAATEERQVFWRVATDLPDADAITEAPAWFTRTDLPDPSIFQSDAGAAPPARRLLARPAQLAAFFRRHLAHERPSGEPDLPRLLRHIVWQEPLRRWPLRLRRRWPARVHLVYDRSPALQPLHDDLAPIARQLHRLLGPRLNLLLADGSPSGLRDEDERPARLESDGASVVLLGDAGQLSPTGESAQAWSRWSAQRESTGRRPLVVAPLPLARVESQLIRHADVCPLDATGALRLATSRAARSAPAVPDVAPLRAALFGNSYITPDLLRDLRVTLQRAGHPLDAAAEAAVWQDPAVGASSVACTLLPAQRGASAADFRRWPEGLREAIAAVHWRYLQSASPLVRAEYVRWLRPELPDTSSLAAAFDLALKEAELLMQQACRAMHQDPDGLGRDLAAYISRFGHRSLPLVQRGDDAMQAAWALSHRDVLRSGQMKPPTGLHLGRLQWLLEADPASAPPAAVYITMRRDAESGALQPVLSIEPHDPSAHAGPALVQFPRFGQAKLRTVVDGRQALKLAVSWFVGLNQALRREDIYAGQNRPQSGSPNTEKVREALYGLVEVALQLACRDFDWAWEQDEDIEKLIENWVRSLPLLGSPPEELDRWTLELAALAGRIDRRQGRTRDEISAELAHALAEQIPSEFHPALGVDTQWLSSSQRMIRMGDTLTLHPELPIELRASRRLIVLEPFHKPAWMRVMTFEQGQWTGSVADQVNPVRWHPRSNMPTLDMSLTEGIPIPHGAWWTRLKPDGELSTGSILAKPDWASRHGVDEHGRWAEFDVSARSGPVTQRLRWIPPGEFWMGSPEAEAECEADGGYDETLHRVQLSQGYWLADTACTQALWEAVLGENPSNFKEDPSNPVEQVSWNDIHEKFLPALNRLVPGLEAGLPSEAQWEYACRAGTQTPFWFGEQITPEQVNYNGNQPYAGDENGEYREKTVPVKSLPANGWGLYEMHGNVWEWCEDVHGEYPSEAVVDPVGTQDGVEGRRRVLRGGVWNYGGRGCRSAFRRPGGPDVRYDDIGFRLARGLGVPLLAGQGAGGAGGQRAEPVALERSTEGKAGTDAKTRKGAA